MRKSAGLLLYKKKNDEVFFFLVHPGGPFWRNKDAGAWTIPKGELNDDENALAAAQREFTEETGQQVSGPFRALEPIKQKGGKLVYAWAVEGEVDAAAIVSTTFKMEWPFKSGQWITVPEVDKGDWFNLEDALIKINSAQAAFISEVIQWTGAGML